MQETKRSTFWKLIQQHVIIIPIIQRDYAQGRAGAEIVHIRKSLLSSLYDAISSGTAVDFDFIYGSIEGNAYIPLDGQQRLTTLFLLHWYLASKEDRLDDSVKNVLDRFSYDTRSSSADFCKALIRKGIPISVFLTPPEGSGVDTISSEIKNESWYFSSWQDDPTVQSMLIMLDDIHAHFHDSNGFFDLLTDDDKAPVTFQSLRLEHFGLSDTLYIKMNARGKPLTNFENFKAHFEKVIDDVMPARKDEISRKMDGIWTDIFWQYKSNENYLFDNELMNFFRAIATNRYALKADVRTGAKIIEKQLTDREVLITFPDYEKWNCFDFDGVADAINTLDCLYNGQDKIKIYLPDTTLIDERSLFNHLIANGKEYTYSERIQFYALSQYIILNGPGGIEAWMRVVRNLTVNFIYNGADEYMRDIKAIHALLPYSSNILEYISDGASVFTGFANVQREEERVKAVLMLKSDEWQKAIIEIENHGYFVGQIGFVLKFSGIKDYHAADSTLSWSDIDNEQFLSKFHTYSRKAEAIFNSSGVKKFGDFIWERALLAKGDYMIQNGANYSFLVDNDRDIGWKRLLREDTERRNYIKEVFDSISVVSQVKDELLEVINAGINNPDVEQWRKLFIRDAGMMAVCGKDKFIRWSDENEPYDILLLKTTRTSGEHRECYSYALYLLLCNMMQKPVYQDVNSVQNMALITSLNGQNLKISYYKYNGAWQYKVEYNGNEHFFERENAVLDFLNENKLIMSTSPITVS